MPEPRHARPPGTVPDGEAALAEHFPHLRPARVRGLALWVCGAILAHGACQSAVVARRCWRTAAATRCAGACASGSTMARTGPPPLRATGLAVGGCFAPLLRWVLVWWRGDRLALAADATLHGDRLAALVW